MASPEGPEIEVRGWNSWEGMFPSPSAIGGLGRAAASSTGEVRGFDLTI